MKIIRNIIELKKLIKDENGIGFVPTMGSIHKAHISLINKSTSLCNKTIVSIFVNKPQFNKKKDFIKYPRTLNKDIKMLKKAKVDYLFVPKNRDIYPKGSKKKLLIHPLSKKLCGRFRPGHFKAVVDVIHRFIKIIKPKKIFLGEKDMQQLKIIDSFLKQIKNKTKVIPCKTVRQSNGVALSSRNLLLNRHENKIAGHVYKTIVRLKKKIINNKISIKFLENKIYKLGVKKIEYLKVIDINKLTKPFGKKKKIKIFIAYYLSSIRLIDNI
jgi:pantoate--beta-alanine ligase